MTFALFGEPFVETGDGVDSVDFAGDGVVVSFGDNSVAVRLEGALLLPRGDGGNAIRGVDCCGVPLGLGDLLEAKADALRCSPFGRPLRLSPRPSDVASGGMIGHTAARALSAVDFAGDVADVSRTAADCASLALWFAPTRGSACSAGP